MEQIFDTDPNSNNYFFLTGLNDNTFKSGKNSFIVNSTDLVVVGKDIDVSFYDSNGKLFSVSGVEKPGSRGIESREL
jgi:hypothetical protein